MHSPHQQHHQHHSLTHNQYTRTHRMEPLQQQQQQQQQQQRRGKGMAGDEEAGGGPTSFLPSDSEGNDAEDDKLLPLKAMPAAVLNSAAPICSSDLQEQASFHAHPSSSPKSPPRGRWKDGFCDWHKNCAPSCLMGALLNCVLLGQVAQRMNYCLRFKEVTFVSLGLWTLSSMLYIALPRNAGPGGLSNLAYFLFFLVVLCQLRGAVRARYAIPGDQFSDCCASLWCSCCTLTQLARHVFNYQGSHGDCSSEPDADLFVVVV